MNLNRTQVLAWLAQEVSPHRLEHILGVEQMAIELAQIHQVNPHQAAQAGLLHDLAKFFPPQKLLHLAQQHRLKIDEICLKTPHLLHADVSAIVAQKEFGVTDPLILQAIANHTLGRPQMDDLSCIIFIADSLEPNRGNSKKLQKLRQLSQKDLKKSVWKVCDYMLKHLMKTHKIIHPRMLLTRNWALHSSCHSPPSIDPPKI